MYNSTDAEKMKPVDYFRQVKAHLQEGKQREALALLEEAVLAFPNEPILLSYYGRFLANVDRKYRAGIETCQKAIKKLRVTENQNESTVYPVFYYNLGKAYSAAGKRKEFIDALNKALCYDPGNNAIRRELRSLGIRRKKPPIPFLDRSNLLNKYIGLALYKQKNDKTHVAETQPRRS